MGREVSLALPVFYFLLELGAALELAALPRYTAGVGLPAGAVLLRGTGKLLLQVFKAFPGDEREVGVDHETVPKGETEKFLLPEHRLENYFHPSLTERCLFKGK
ncbi:MAG: hypothetical protein ACOCZP_02430 [Candidatus Hadarchaeota archaeon]